MKTIKIRHGVFETNSSSSHSISLCLEEFKPSKWYIEDGVCEIYPGEFGWEEEEYNDPQTKASYILTYLNGVLKDKDAKNNSELMELFETREKLFIEVMKEEIKADKIIFCESSWSMPHGHIDHQSNFGEGDVAGPMFASKETLRAFIFNSKSILRTDNDNYA